MADTHSLKAFRVLWGTLTAGIWMIAVYLAVHTSENPLILNHYSPGYFAFLVSVLAIALAISYFNATSWLARLYRLRWPIILCAGSTLFSLAMLEIGVRLLDPLGISYYSEGARYHMDKIPDADLVFRHRPSWESTYHGVTARFNAQGLRDEVIQPKEPSEFRILALGDSVTFGTGVEQDRIFTVRLQELLKTRLGRPVRVINTGVGGYNTVQEYNYLIKEGLSFDPDMIILTYVTNDIEVNEGPFDPWTSLSFQGKSPPEAAQLLLGKSWLYRLGHHAKRYGWLSMQEEQSAASAQNSPGWRDSMAVLGNLAAVAEQRNIPLKVFFFRWLPNGFNTRLLEDVRKAVVPYAVEDMSLWFSGIDVRQYSNSVVDSHPNAEGHRLIAEKMAESLADHIPKF